MDLPNQKMFHGINYSLIKYISCWVNSHIYRQNRGNLGSNPLTISKTSGKTSLDF